MLRSYADADGYINEMLWNYFRSNEEMRAQVVFGKNNICKAYFLQAKRSVCMYMCKQAAPFMYIVNSFQLHEELQIAILKPRFISLTLLYIKININITKTKNSWMK